MDTFERYYYYKVSYNCFCGESDGNDSENDDEVEVDWAGMVCDDNGGHPMRVLMLLLADYSAIHW